MGYSKGHGLQPFINRISHRSALTDEEKQVLLDLPGQTIELLANQDFVRLGDRVDHACLIVDGMVGRFDQNRQGGRQITAIHIPGDMADLHSVVQPQAVSALQALSTATILRVPHRASERRQPGTRRSPRRSGAIAWSTPRSSHSGS